MSWKSALTKTAPAVQKFSRPHIEPYPVDFSRVVTVDFETYYDTHYTLKKLSTSEYVRDERFKIQMVGIKIGRKPTQVLTEAQARKVLSRINWGTHTLLCHNTMFDGFILSEHFGIVPSFYFDTLSMARALHSNEIGAGLDEVAKYYGGEGKIDGLLEQTKGLLEWSPEIFELLKPYCAQDVDETFRIFEAMVPKFPRDEMRIIDLTMRMFCDPVLVVDTDRLQAEYERELAEREELFFRTVEPHRYDEGGDRYDPVFFRKSLLKTGAERALQGKERLMLIAQRLLGNNEFFANLLRAEGVEPPVKISKAWMKKEGSARSEDDKYNYAFAKDDEEFTSLPERMDLWRGDLDPNNADDVPALVAKQERLRDLVNARLSVKSTINITRAERMLKAGEDGKRLPAGYAYYRAHTGRYGGTNKMNLQNLPRGSELRLSIMAPDGYELCVVDSGQIEARVNAWLWDQLDLLDAFRKADTWDKSKGVARGNDRDAYCRFADDIYGREITTEDKTERHVGKVCLAADTRVFTNHGLKPIVDVQTTDLVWDGEQWVSHDGLLDQGIKAVLRYRGLAATEDHEILTEHGWLAWSEVLTNPSLFQSALGSASLPPSSQLLAASKEDCEPLRQKTRVYDLANAGPNKRFAVLTDDGPVIVHNCVLGLGYQMGAPKLQMTLAKGALGGPPIYFDLNKCYEIVNAYRRRNHKIRDGWTKCQNIIEDMALGRTGAYKCLSWEKETIWLPNGMRLHYPDLRAEVDPRTEFIQFSYANKDGRTKIYGGLLCENIVQALARIIVFTQMLAINERYRVVMSTHDEVVAMPRSRDAQKCFDYMMKCMTTPPAWCQDIPLNAEGGWARNYSK